MKELSKEYAAPTAMGNGNKSKVEATKLLDQFTPNGSSISTYFWNRQSQSVEPLRIHNGWASQ